MEILTVFADGSCLKNPGGRGGWASVLCFPDKVIELGGHAPETTNNRMEIFGVIAALEHIKDTGLRVRIFSDSKYLVQSASVWRHNWKKRNWMRFEKKVGEVPVKNRDLWERLDVALSGREHLVEFAWVPGHSGIAGNERCDEIASAFAIHGRARLFTGSISDHPVGSRLLHIPQRSHAPQKNGRKSRKKKSSRLGAKQEKRIHREIRGKRWEREHSDPAFRFFGIQKSDVERPKAQTQPAQQKVFVPKTIRRSNPNGSQQN